VLTKEDNEVLTRVGPGTLMGNLLRRYWQPALLSVEVPAPDSPPVRVRLLGEDLVAFRDTDGKVGLLAQNCPHRGASLFFGRNEERGLRCVYHGWKFDTEGACVDMPSEPAESNFKNKVRATAYATYESGGIVFAYMGPKEKQPAFRDFGWGKLPPDQVRASKIINYCNFMQGLEGNFDTTHISFLHSYHTPPGNTPNPPVYPEGDETDRPGYPSRALRHWIHFTQMDPILEVEETWYGFRYAGIRKTPKGYLSVRVSDFIFPAFTYPPQPWLPVGGDAGNFLVPIDDHSHWRFGIETNPEIREAQVARGLGDAPPPGGPGARAFYGRQPIIPRPANPENDYLIDREKQSGQTYSGIEGIVTQDFAVTESMGQIYDRTKEHLGTSDRAVIRLRRMLIDAAKDLAEGIEPPALAADKPYDRIRAAERIILPGEDWRLLGTDADPIMRELLTEAQA
jgi:nitrite reductase/ring-hydroxylating ferredoxin subunit